MAAAVAEHPTRLVGFFMSTLGRRRGERLSRALDDWQLRGVCLFPAMHRYRLDDERVAATFEAAAERAAPPCSCTAAC